MKLTELDKSIKELPGIGPKALLSYKALGINTMADLVMMPVRGYEDRTKRVCIGNQVDSQAMTNTIVKVLSKSFFGKSRKNVKAIVEDTQNGVRGELLGFNRAFLDKVLYVGCYYHLYANVMPSDGFKRPQFSQFEIKTVQEDSNAQCSGAIMGVYSLSGTLTQNIIRRDIKNLLSRIDFIEDILPQQTIDQFGLINLDSAIRKNHFPQTEEDIVLSKKTLSFTEVFYLQLMALRRPSGKSIRKATGQAITSLEEKFVQNLSFELTDDQKKVLLEIRSDMADQNSMNRLLQGDVGCGKTIVAWISALHMIACKRQVAFMAPTELLARQHAQSASQLFEKCNISVAYLDGQVQGKSRTLLLNNLKEGNIDLLIGTHALFSEDVVFKDLGYVIIDEQHRFGVEQRSALFKKGQNPDVLLMTATPIPRTLALTVYGNLNVSTIKTMPKGRLPVKTFVVSQDKREQMYDAVGVELSRGHQAYFVYPLIEASEESTYKRDVQTMYEVLSKRYAHFKGSLIHSRLADEEKLRILNDFTNKKLDFLVATSVVEVGLDVQDATCMVVENAQIFGLSALHQLRGRVGRSTLQSWCFLVYEDNITEDGKKRLGVLRRSNDGFEIAEEDLKIRGPGEITGLRQSGFTNLKYANLEKDIKMMALARDHVMNILKEDPGLLSLQNSVIRQNLVLFENKEVLC